VTDHAGWRAEVDDITERRRRALGMGGDDGLARQHAKGKLDARERIARVVDDATFREVGVLTGTADLEGRFLPSNIVVGTGRINGRRVVVESDDFTVRAGTPEPAGGEKRVYIEAYAKTMRIPVVRFVDQAGASLRAIEDQGYTKIPTNPLWDWLDILSEIPVVAVACGPAPGMGAWRVAASHFSVQVRGIGQVFAAGPPVVAAGMGQIVTAEELGGAEVHAEKSGVVDSVAEDEDDAVRQVRAFLSYLPSNARELPTRVPTDDPPDRADDHLVDVIPRNPRRVYDIRSVLSSIFDRDSIFEIGAGWGRSSVVGFARLDGYAVGFFANDPRYFGGGMDDLAAEKFARHVDLCDTFHLPVVNLVDQPGTVIGPEHERRGTVRKGLRALSAVEQSSVPWCSVVLRRLFGLGGATYGPWRRLNTRIGWPSARWGSMPIEGGVDALYRRDIEAAESPAERRAELEAKFAAMGSPLKTAEKFGINDVIDPRETRAFLCDWVEDAYRILEPGIVRRGMRP
jgi:acetyl-CoA carboxylase carboxyltransferase component